MRPGDTFGPSFVLGCQVLFLVISVWFLWIDGSWSKPWAWLWLAVVCICGAVIGIWLVPDPPYREKACLFGMTGEVAVFLWPLYLVKRSKLRRLARRLRERGFYTPPEDVR